MTHVNRSAAAIPGTRPWATTRHSPEAGPRSPLPTQTVPFYCRGGHETAVPFAADAEAPPEWDCPQCGLPAGLDPGNPPAPPRSEPYRTHLGYVKERRKPKEQEQILAEAMAEAAAGRGAR